MDKYENIYKLQLRGYSFDTAQHLDEAGIRFDADDEQIQEYIDERNDYLIDLEERGFYNGTDDPVIDEMIERGNQFQDKYDMYRNEY